MSIILVTLPFETCEFITEKQCSKRIQTLKNILNYTIISFTDGKKYFECKCKQTANINNMNCWNNEKYIIEVRYKHDEWCLYERTHLFIFKNKDEYDEVVNQINSFKT